MTINSGLGKTGSEDTGSRPSAGKSRGVSLLVALGVNALVWLALLIWTLRDAYLLGWVIAFVSTAISLVLTSGAIIVLHLLAARRIARAWVRAIIYAIPTVGLVGVLLILPAGPPKPNQKHGEVSPSGAYTLSVPIEDDRWRVSIRDAAGDLEYRDAESEFLGWFSAYWCWDADDRVWLYNSDCGRVFFWEKSESGWKKTWWGHQKVGFIERDIAPPLKLYPHYVKPGPARSQRTTWALRGFGKSEDSVSVSLYDHSTGRSLDLDMGQTVQGVTLLSADWDRQTARIRVKDREVTLRMSY